MKWYSWSTPYQYESLTSKNLVLMTDHTHVREGFPEEVIPEVAKEIEAELVILGTVGRTGLSAALLGNTAEHVISKLSCNLLAIKPSKK